MTNWTHSLPENVTRVEDVLTYANTLTDNYFGMVTLLLVFTVFFLSMKSRWKTEESLASASFVTAVSSYFFLLVGIIPEWVALLTTFMVVVATIGLVKK